MRERYPDVQVVGVKCDVSNEAEVEALVQTAVDQMGRLDVMVRPVRVGGWGAAGCSRTGRHHGRQFNNAGIMHGADDDAIKTEERVWDLTQAINVKGVWYGCKHAVLAMRKVGLCGYHFRHRELTSRGHAEQGRAGKGPARRRLHHQHGVFCRQDGRRDASAGVYVVARFCPCFWQLTCRPPRIHRHHLQGRRPRDDSRARHDPCARRHPLQLALPVHTALPVARMTPLTPRPTSPVARSRPRS